MVIVNVGNQLMGLVDTALAGRLGALSLGGVGLGATLFMAGGLFGVGVALGVDALASQALGGGDARRARRAMWHGVYAALLVTLPVVAAVFGASHLLESIGIDPALAETTRAYLTPVLAGCLPMFVGAALRSYLQAARRTGILIACTLVANTVNLVADWILIFGDEGLVQLGLPAMGIPAYGIRGLAWATVLSQGVFMVSFAIAVRGVEAGAGAGSLRRFEAMLLRRVLSLGIPIGLQILAEVGIFSLVGVLAATFGVIAVGANEVALKPAALMFMVPLGVSMATSVEVGRAIGRRDAEGTRRAGLLGIKIGGGYMILSAVLMETLPGTLARIMTTDPEVIPVATGLIRIAGIFQFFDGIQVVGSGALRGAGLTRWAMWANVIAYWGVGMPLGLSLAFGAGLGVRGLWWGLTGGLGVAAIILTWKFAKVSRRPIAPIEGSAG